MILQRCAHPRPCYDDGKCHYKGECGHKATLTNADRIRAMSDEELATFISEIADECERNYGCDIKYCVRESCLKWLQQPAGEEDKHETV